LRCLFRLLANLFAVAAFLLPVAFWLTGWAIILGVGPSEHHAIQDRDRPDSYQRLTFGPWKKGTGPCISSQILWLHPDALILEHRIGKAAGIITRFTYYEAKYQMPDKTLRVTHATGPIPMISHREETMVASFFGCTVLALGFFRASSRASSRPQTLLPKQSCTEQASNGIVS
jgi:hypothetical protein